MRESGRPGRFVGHSLGAAVAVRAVRSLEGVVGLFSIEGNLTPETLWRIGCAAKTASRRNAMGKEYRALPVAKRHYRSRENTPRETQVYIRRHGLQHVVFTGGHWPMVEQPDATVLQIRAFFEPLFAR